MTDKIELNKPKFKKISDVEIEMSEIKEHKQPFFKGDLERKKKELEDNLAIVVDLLKKF